MPTPNHRDHCIFHYLYPSSLNYLLCTYSYFKVCSSRQKTFSLFLCSSVSSGTHLAFLLFYLCDFLMILWFQCVGFCLILRLFNVVIVLIFRRFGSWFFLGFKLLVLGYDLFMLFCLENGLSIFSFMISSQGFKYSSFLCFSLTNENPLYQCFDIVDRMASK